MALRCPRPNFVVSCIAPGAVALALTLGVSGAQAAAGSNEWWELGPSGGYGCAMAIQTDGKIVVAGSSKTWDFMLARYTANGHLDTAFGKNGKVLTDFGGTEIAAAVAIQPDGEIVVAGYSSASGSDDFALARYTTSGTLDPSFGTGGKVLTDFGSSSADVANAIAIQPDGKIVAAGYRDTGGGKANFALARYTTNGTLDTSFGTGGKVLTSFGAASYDSVASVAIQPNGKIVVAGNRYTPKSDTFALARYTTNGRLDTSFGRGGKVLTGFGYRSGSEAAGVAIQRNGKIVAVGNTYGGTAFALARYTRRGHLDPRFGTRGRVRTSFNSWGGQAGGTALAIQTDGKIVASGVTTISGAAFADCNGSPSSIALARYTTRGRLDKSFGKGGKVAKHFGTRNSTYTCAIEYAAAVAIQPDGKIIAAGGLSDPARFLLARYLP